RTFVYGLSGESAVLPDKQRRGRRPATTPGAEVNAWKALGQPADHHPQPVEAEPARVTREAQAEAGDQQPDPTAYIPAKDCRSDHIPPPRQQKDLRAKEPDTSEGIRRYHRGQRLYVHAGDWHRWNAEQKRLRERAMDEASQRRAEQEVEKMKA